AAVSSHFEGNKNPYVRADDKGQPSSPKDALSAFQTGKGLMVETVLSEPLVRQPLYLDFDERGRLWVVQYIQYPNPAGLEVLTWDKHLRKVFDQVPPPPPFTAPEHRKFIGQDKITIHEDTNGDGTFDLHKTFLDGLNMVTSLAHGHGGVWVLHPPYLLFYPDRNQDDIPDDRPVVHLSGFNLEDTHSISNSLKFGPDGWLYGCTGSTVTARVRVHLDENAPRHAFLGQNIWRYHPTRHVFELFAEGGWNNFGVDFDDDGRLYSGTNGTQQAVHFVQGGYYQKGFGKHGPHTNPYTFGHFFGMPIKGEKIRLVHQWIRYSSGAIPGLEGRLIGPNSLGNKVHALRMEARGSTFSTVEEEKPLQTGDKWFRPIHCAIGPDGAIYVADFYDARITHVDPRDNWDRSNGRVHRIRAVGSQPWEPVNLGKLPSAALTTTLFEGNQWARRHARRILTRRGELPTLKLLKDALVRDPGSDGRSRQKSLEALWVLQGMTFPGLGVAGMQELLSEAIMIPNPNVQRWIIRAAADNQVDLGTALRQLARKTKHPEVVSQLASSAQRLGDRHLIASLATRGEFTEDPFIPLQLWWAMEALITRHPDRARDLLSYAGFWETPLFEKVLRERIGRRYMAERSPGSLRMCAWLLEKASGTRHLDPLIRGMEQALEGTSLDPVPPELDAALASIWKNQRVSDDVIRLSLRLKSPLAIAAARPLLTERKTPATQRIEFIKALGELGDAPSEGIFLSLFRDEKMEPAIRLAALTALRRYSGEEIPATLLALYPRLQGDLRQVS
ncbi:MAG: PVC-type heme-binding CxxCH protein, partial [Verrucomicrobiota bacterium]|nr:PVC-type heme-binding CxxCH protein [Verrucomicrobiota bacterium]